MKVAFLLNLDLEHKAGLYNAIHNRMKIQKEQFDSIFYNIVTIDSKPLCFFKRLFKYGRIYSYKGNDEVIIDNVRYINIYYKNSIIGKIFDYLRMDYFKYRSIIKKIQHYVEDMDMIIAHFGYPQGRIAYYINKIYKIKYITYYHGSDIHTFAMKNKKNKSIVFESMVNASMNIFVSRALMNQAINMGYTNSNLISSCNGIDINIFKYKRDIYKENNKKVIGFVGNLEYVKRAEFLPEIFKQVKKNYLYADFVIIGDGSFRKSIERKCNEYNISVNFTGRIDQEKVSEYLNTLDILILPSRKEAWGCILLEANACGVYCIGSNTGGIPEAMGEDGILVENSDATIVNDMSNSIIKVINSEIDRDKLLNRARKFSWSEICSNENNIILNSVIRNR